MPLGFKGISALLRKPDAKERIAFGKPIANLQAIQWMVADTTVDLHASQSLTLKAAAKSVAKASLKNPSAKTQPSQNCLLQKPQTDALTELFKSSVATAIAENIE